MVEYAEHSNLAQFFGKLNVFKLLPRTPYHPTRDPRCHSHLSHPLFHPLHITCTECNIGTDTCKMCASNHINSIVSSKSHYYLSDNIVWFWTDDLNRQFIYMFDMKKDKTKQKEIRTGLSTAPEHRTSPEPVSSLQRSQQTVVFVGVSARVCQLYSSLIHLSNWTEAV